MQVKILRRKSKCIYCGDAIYKDERALQIAIPAGPFYQKKLLHRGCVLPYLDEWWDRVAASCGRQRRRGKYPAEVRTEAHRIQSLKCYYKKMGNLEKVAELESVLRRMKNVVQTTAGTEEGTEAAEVAMEHISGAKQEIPPAIRMGGLEQASGEDNSDEDW